MISSQFFMLPFYVSAPMPLPTDGAPANRLSPSCTDLAACPPQQVAAKIDIDSATGLPIADGTNWVRSKDELWSIPVLVKDSAGDYTAVLDRKRQEGIGGVEFSSPAAKIGMVSNWSRRTLRVSATGLRQTCFYFICSKQLPLISVEDIEVKVGDRVFHPQPGDGKLQSSSADNNEISRFQISDSLAAALR
ncbi:MAG: hypothetical protein WCD18_09660, partial [Thermosynechococcaceae cyanobacterium]